MNYVTVEGRALKQAMRIINAVVERRTTIPILGAARLTLTEEGLSIAGTDLDMEATSHVDVMEASGDVQICIEARTLAKIASVAGPMAVRIEPPAVPGDRAAIIVGDGEATYEVPTLSPADFPDIKASHGDLIEAFGNGSLAAMLSKVRWCISTEETRYYLNGVLWQASKAGKRFAATDGHRLSACRYSPDPVEASTSVIIPRRAVAVIIDHFAGRDVKVWASTDPTKLIFTAPGMQIITKLIDGTYPDIDRVIPTNAIYDVCLPRDEIASVVSRAMALGDKSRAIRFFDKGGQVSVERRDHDFGSVVVPTSAKWPCDKNAKLDPFAFNGRYIREMIALCAGPITLRITDPGSPAMIVDEDATMTRVLMPMRA